MRNRQQCFKFQFLLSLQKEYWLKKKKKCEDSYGLNVCAPSKFTFESLIPHGILLEGGPVGGDKVIRVETSYMGWVSPESILTLSTMWGCKAKTAVCDPEEGSYWNPTMLPLWSWTSSLQNCEKQTNFFVYKPPNPWHFVTAAWNDQDKNIAI